MPRLAPTPCRPSHASIHAHPGPKLVCTFTSAPPGAQPPDVRRPLPTSGPQAGYEIPTLDSLLLVLGVLGTGVGLSVLEVTAGPEDAEDAAPDEGEK